nr:male germ cell-associated kinase [Ipomoea batatas]
MGIVEVLEELMETSEKIVTGIKTTKSLKVSLKKEVCASSSRVEINQLGETSNGKTGRQQVNLITYSSGQDHAGRVGINQPNKTSNGKVKRQQVILITHSMGQDHVLLDFNSKGLISLRTWSKYAFGQIAICIKCYHSKKCLMNGFSSMWIFFSFPLSIALSDEPFFNDQFRMPTANAL